MSEKKPSSPLTPDFSSLVVSIASAALVKMGLDPESREARNMDLARYNIDMLSLLKTKTKGHLTEKESRLLDSFISDLQMEFVKHSRNTGAKDHSKTTPSNKTSRATEKERETILEETPQKETIETDKKA